MSYESRLIKLENRSAVKSHAVLDCRLEITPERAEAVRLIMLDIPCLAEDGSESDAWAELCKHLSGQDSENINKSE